MNKEKTIFFCLKFDTQQKKVPKMRHFCTIHVVLFKKQQKTTLFLFDKK